MQEAWCSVVGFEGLYEVSNLGRVRSLKANKILQPAIKSNGYQVVILSRHWTETSHKLVHRLVAEAFIPNPGNLPQVHHKDENKCNNCADNLEWCTAVYNVRQSTAKIVQQIKDGKVIAEYPSTYAAAKATGNYACSIAKCCRGDKKYPHPGGYVWRYRKD